MSTSTKPTEEPLTGATPVEGGAEVKAPWRKIAWLALLAGVLVAVVYFSPLRGYLSRVQELSAYIKGLGWLGPVVLTLGIAVLVGVGFPRLLFCVIAGMAMGFWWGLLWAQLGTLIGNYVMFVVARRGGREWAQRYLTKRGHLHDLIRREGALGVILARQVPVPNVLVNLACGLFGVRHRHFLLGTLLGQLPEAVPCTLIGAGMLKGSFAKSFGLISLAVVLAVVVWLALRTWMRRQRAEQSP